MNKKLLVVCLAAGAFLLPSVAAAGVVSGACVNCHTMHNSQNGAGVNGGAGEQANLLTGTGCVGCHATGAGNEAATGKALLSPNAPQVDDSTNTNNGGYFDVNANDANKHNVVDFLTENNDADLGTIPGGSGSTASGGSPVLGCSGCHTVAGHHGTGTSYRMLAGGMGLAVADADYGATNPGNGLGNRAGTTYDATVMNSVCGACHPDFHGGVGDADVEGATNGDWIWVRHPTDISLTAAQTSGSAPSIVLAATSDAVPLGEDGTDSDAVMCISCHNAHGSNYADLLAYDYTAQLAGGTAATSGCETCHSYGGNGM